MASRLTLISPRIDKSLVKFVDALLCKPGIEIHDIEAIGRLVVSGFKAEDSDFNKSQGDACINLAVMHRLTGLKTGMSIYQNSLTLFLDLLRADPERAKWVALTHHHNRARQEFTDMWCQETGNVITEVDLEARDNAWKNGSMLVKLYPPKTYKAMEKMLSERLGQKDAKTKASETQKEANKAALAQGIEGAEKVTGK
jgi:hypothetical protein